MTYPFPTRHDTQFTYEISYRFESTDCISKVTSYIYRIEVNGNRDNFMRIPESNRPETRHDTEEQEIVRIWQRQIAKAKRHDMYTQLRLTITEIILSGFKANRPGDASATKSVEVNCNEFIIRELEGYQSLYQWYSISCLPIKSIDDYRENARAHTSIRVTSPPMPKLASLQRRFTNHKRCTSIHIADGSWYPDRLLHHWMESVMLRKLRRSVPRHIPRTKCTNGGSGRIFAICMIHN